MLRSVKKLLAEAKVSFRETKRAEGVPGPDQAPDFIVPDEFTPLAIIEAKLAEDDGTACDKVARRQRLRTLRDDQGKDYDVMPALPVAAQGEKRGYAPAISGN